MSTETDRNPSPPPEILRNDELLPDRIGDSMYSKQWLYKTLLSIMEVVEESIDSETDIVELDATIEENACTLWDMSANFEVAEFLLLECSVVEIFFEVIEKTKSPRLLEIVIGILGNISSFELLCQVIAQSKPLLLSVIGLSGTSDSPTLLQVFRVILCGLANEETQNLWFNLLQETLFFMENMKFIFENNLNSSVLKGAFELLSRIVNEKLHYSVLWSQQSHTVAILEASKQLLKTESFEDLDQVFIFLKTMCQHSSNIQVYVDNFAELQPIFQAYITKLADEETLPHQSRIVAIASCFASYGLLLQSSNMNKESHIIDSNFFKAIHKIFLSIEKFIMNIKKDEESKSEDNSTDCPMNTVPKENGTETVTQVSEEELDDWQMLLDAVKALISYIEQEDELLFKNITDSEKSSDEREEVS